MIGHEPFLTLRKGALLEMNVKLQCKGSLLDRPTGRKGPKSAPPGADASHPAVTYATSTPVRLRSQIFLNHNRKYFILCRYGRPGGRASPRAQAAPTTACTRRFL